MQTTLGLLLDAIREYCAKQPIRRLSVFGSALHGNMRPDSDIDLLVEYVADARVGLEFFQHMVDLGEIIGREVDLRTPEDLSRFFRESVCKEARPIFESQQDE
ncbi:MAG: nucleotidyltransferase domain-containing protein [Chloroflexi bacterium]|nr:nucleotidyltransferase domain-containing protein [Chloroflexota bacterium]